MKNPALFFGGIIIAILGIALGVFFVIPGVNHIITTPLTGPHYKHAAACFVLGVLGIIVALVNRPKAA